MLRTLIVLALCLCATPAHAQQPVFGDAATQPGKDRVTVRQTATYTEFAGAVRGSAFTGGSQTTVNTNVTFGVTGRFSLSLDAPIVFRNTDSAVGDDTFRNFGDFTLLARYRVHQDDLGPVDTFRVMAVAGVEIPSYADGISSDSFDPTVGLSSMLILGRHGFNASARWKFTTGDDPLVFSPGDGEADSLRYDASYAYRLSPGSYTSETRGALYLLSELSGLYETNGDHELLLGPSLLWEAKTYALEVGVQFSAISDVESRFERETRFVFGFRLLF